MTLKISRDALKDDERYNYLNLGMGDFALSDFHEFLMQQGLDTQTAQELFDCMMEIYMDEWVNHNRYDLDDIVVKLASTNKIVSDDRYMLAEAQAEADAQASDKPAAAWRSQLEISIRLMLEHIHCQSGDMWGACLDPYDHYAPDPDCLISKGQWGACLYHLKPTKESAGEPPTTTADRHPVPTTGAASNGAGQ